MVSIFDGRIEFVSISGLVKEISIDDMLLGASMQVVYDLIVDNAEISRKDVEEKLGVSQTMSGRILKQLVLKGAIQSVGKGKATKYILAKQS